MGNGGYKDWFNTSNIVSNSLHCYNQGWGGLDWSRWVPLGQGKPIPRKDGVYRIRHTSEERPWLERIGETGQENGLRGRIHYQLARQAFEDRNKQIPWEKKPDTAPHKASPCINAISKEFSGELEVSWAIPEGVENSWWRKGLEKALFALHRQEIGHSPTCFQGRMIPGYEDWDLRKKQGITSDAREGPGPLDWKKNKAPKSRDWMGLDWSEPRQLSDLNKVELPKVGLYKTWYASYPNPRNSENPQPLLYIGEGNIRKRLQERRDMNFDGPHAYFSATPSPKDVDSTRKRKEIEAELIGAHHLFMEYQPLDQDTHQFYRPK